MQHHDLKPLIRIGKAGLTENIVSDIKRQLHQKKLFKIKLLKSFLEEGDKQVILSEIVEKTGARVVHKVGGVIVLAKPDGKH